MYVLMLHHVGEDCTMVPSLLLPVSQDGSSGLDIKSLRTLDLPSANYRHNLRTVMTECD
jgi:hypothetical protein